MALLRGALLAASQNRWLRERAPRYWFVRRTASRFMPGETAEDALAAAAQLQAQHGIAALFTELGENISDDAEATLVTRHYLELLDQIGARQAAAEVSVKLTQLGVDLSSSKCYGNLRRIVQHAGEKSTVWIDMEASPYVDITIELYRRLRAEYSNVGVCLQAYLYRTAQDVAALMPLGPAIRLVKGAYKEPANIAYPRKSDVDENYFALARALLSPEARRAGVRLGIATHDSGLIRRITDFAAAAGLARDQYEFQMLYGIQRAELIRLAKEGYRTRVLISYGYYWFPWFMRRLAERPANAWFVVRNLFAA